MHAQALARRTVMVAVLAAFSIASIGCATAQGAAAGTENKVIFQVSDNDPGKWNLTLNNAKNVQADLGAGKVKIEIVAYGPGINMLKMESAVANRINAAIQSGVAVVACENTMTNQKLTKADMLPAIGYVPAGVVELMQRQQQGWAYIKP